MRPAPRRPGNSSTWSVMRAPAESTSQKIGSSWRSACSVRRTIFSTVRAPHEPALTVGSLAMTHTGRPSMRPTPVTTPSAGRSPAAPSRWRAARPRRTSRRRAAARAGRARTACAAPRASRDCVSRLPASARSVALLELLARARSRPRRMARIGDVVVDRRRREVACGLDAASCTARRGRRPGSRRRKPAMRSSPNMLLAVARLGEPVGVGEQQVAAVRA